ncbi:GntR family transcriptional regulator [Streptomyces tubercidicus]|uniref:GntR family transcriptional regulator n=1 Tax=Streptomyces tubercidicus TaxID=47759 RepID=UPI0037A4A130
MTTSATAAKRTRTDDVHARLRADILSGDLRPAQQLRFRDLGARYDASVGVIREALIRLTEQGLVRSEPRHGFQVTPLTDAAYAELTEARTELEALVLRRAITDGDLAWESRLVAAHHRFCQTPRTDPADPERPTAEWLDAHTEFHIALLNGCANRRLLTVASTLREETELYRRWSRPAPGFAAPADPALLDEHNALLNAALARDADRAEAALRALIGLSRILQVDTGSGE